MTMTGHQKGLVAEYFTVGWNVVEGVIAIGAGVVAGSIALVGFGLDSTIEVASGLVLIWRLRKHGFGDEEDEEMAEKKAVFFRGGYVLCISFLCDLRIREEAFLAGAASGEPDRDHTGHRLLDCYAMVGCLEEENRFRD